MPNTADNAYALTLLCPIKNGEADHQSYGALTRRVLQGLGKDLHSPMARVPETFFCRFYILNDVFYEAFPAKEDHLKSRYLVFSSNFHGSLENYLSGFWQNAQPAIKEIWQHCVAFDKVTDEASFIDYIKQCQVTTTFFFNGSTGEPLAEQLKALYLRQEFTRFVMENQCADAQTLHAEFQKFVATTCPFDNTAPTWEPGKNTI